ncbi:unnamed protein product [Pedinophyceae sp. YPF-701]|nr:unnamed protein product [Pedinophyceae sp. YPF-701]
MATGADGKMTVAITGGTGLVGTRLTQRLAAEGHAVRILTRNPDSARTKFAGVRNVSCHAPSEWAAAIKGSTGVVNLAGEPIATRWNEGVKKEIRDSRLNATRKLVDAINACPEGERPEVLVSSSAVGFYGTSDTNTYDETSAPGSDFLAKLCVEWEAEANKSSTARTVIVRTGIVLAAEGGALGKMLPVFQVFAGGPLGSGSQWFSWIHRDDLVGIMVKALEDKSFASGVYNGTAPNPVRMSEMCDSLGRVIGRPSWLPVPEFALQTLLGEGAMVVLDGQKVVPAATEKAGYQFKYADIDAAVRNLVR